MAGSREEGLDIVRKMIPPDVGGQIGSPAPDAFASELGELSLTNVFGNLWARPGLDLRSRSLVTLGILIALRATSEFQIHVRIALRNGLTRAEIEEVIYHATGYCGFPAAASAREAAMAALAKESEAAQS